MVFWNDFPAQLVEREDLAFVHGGEPYDTNPIAAKIEKKYAVQVRRIPIGPVGMTEGCEEQVWHMESPFIDEQWGNTHKFLGACREAGARTLIRS